MKRDTPKSFVQILSNLDNGQADVNLSEYLQDCIVEASDEAIRINGDATATLKVEFIIAVTNNGQVGIGYKIDKKLPKKKFGQSLMWVDNGYNLTAENPKQMKMELRDINDDRSVKNV